MSSRTLGVFSMYLVHMLMLYVSSSPLVVMSQSQVSRSDDLDLAQVLVKFTKEINETGGDQSLNKVLANYTKIFLEHVPDIAKLNKNANLDKLRNHGLLKMLNSKPVGPGNDCNYSQYHESKVSQYRSCPIQWNTTRRQDTFPFERPVANCVCQACIQTVLGKETPKCQPVFTLVPAMVKVSSPNNNSISKWRFVLEQISVGCECVL